MKRLLFVVAALCLVSSVFAFTPELLSSTDLNLTTNFTNVMIKEIDDEHYAVLSQPVTGGQCRLRVVNSETGMVTDTSPAFTCSSINDIDVDLGTIVVCYIDSPRQRFRVYKWPGPGFLTYKAQSSGSTTSPAWGGCKIDSSSSTSADILVTNYRPTSSYFAGIVKVYFNGSSTNFTSYPIVVPFSYKNPYDDDNEVYAFQNNLDANFYNNTNPYNTSGKILSTLTLGEDISVWNHNSNAPIWMTENGYMEIITDYTSPLETSGSISMDYILAVAAQSEVYGLISNSWYIADFTSPGSPSTTSLGMTIDNYVTYPLFYDADIFRTYTSDKKIYIANAAGIITVYQYSGGLTGESTVPIYTVKFLGTDTEDEYFIFEQYMNDVEGGTVFSAFQYGIQGTLGDIERGYDSWKNDYTSEDDKFIENFALGSFEEREECFLNYTTVTYTIPGDRDAFTADGALLYNRSACPNILITDFPPAFTKDSDEVVVRVAFFDEPIIASTVVSSLSFFDTPSTSSTLGGNPVTGKRLLYLRFSTSSGGIVVSYYDSDMVLNNLGSSGSWNVSTDYIDVEATINFVTNDIEVTVRQANGTIVAQGEVPFFDDTAELFASIRYGEVSSNGKELYLDYYEAKSYFTSSELYPEYTIYGSLLPGGSLIKSLKVPIPGGGGETDYGTYEARMYGTDQDLGLDFYGEPYDITFYYNALTMEYTDAALEQLIANHQSNLPVEEQLVEGDWITSLYNAFELYGIKTPGSKFLLGMFLWMIIALPAAAAAGPEVGIIAGVLGFVVFSYLGLFPAWFIIVMVIVSGFVMFMGFRKMVQG